MDRTAWIVVTLCTAGLIAWFWTLPQPQPRITTGPEIVQAVAGTPAAAAWVIARNAAEPPRRRLSPTE